MVLSNVSVLFSDEDKWLTQKQISELYDTSRQNITQHIDGIYSDGELERDSTSKKFLRVQTEGTRQVSRNTEHYNLDMIIALGYRVQSQVATRFRRWATVRLHAAIVPELSSAICSFADTTFTPLSASIFL